LDADWLVQNPDANFLTPEIAEYTRSRAREVIATGGTLHEKRLMANLLSSMPLCFNLFGHLRANMSDAASPLSRIFNLDIAEVNLIEAEWAPSPRENYLNDRTAFDAYVEYITNDGRRGFLGVETKYTELFSAKEYPNPILREVTESSGSGFCAGAADVLKGSRTNQLWRNALLVVKHRDLGDFEFGHVVVLHCDGDEELKPAMNTFQSQLVKPESLLRTVTYQSFINVLMDTSVFKNFAADFKSRYLDLSPVVGMQLN